MAEFYSIPPGGPLSANNRGRAPQPFRGLCRVLQSGFLDLGSHSPRPPGSGYPSSFLFRRVGARGVPRPQNRLWGPGMESPADFLISTAESAPRGIAALVPVGSAPELSHTRTEPPLSCRSCGTYRHGLSAPGSNSPIRPVPTPRRYAPDRHLDHHAWQSPRHDLDGQPAKAEFVLGPGPKRNRSGVALPSDDPIVLEIDLRPAILELVR